MVSFIWPDKQARAIYLRGTPFKPQYSLSSNQTGHPYFLNYNENQQQPHYCVK
mgnify:CR=1 FL=1